MSMAILRTYAFLDRDGTLVAERSDEQWAGCRAVELLPGVGPALRGLARAGFSLVVVTNQYPIGEGIVSAEDYAAQAATLLAAAEDQGATLLDVLHCPHPRWSPCPCAKPATGMIDEAQRRHGVLDAERSVVVGDSDVDLQLATAAGIRGCRVDQAILGEPPPERELARIVEEILEVPPGRA